MRLLPAVATPCVVLAIASLVAGPAVAETVILDASRDGTLFGNSGDIGNSAGESLHIGLTGEGNVRRAIVGFDLTSIPSDATIDSVALSLTVTKTTATADTDISVFVVSGAWGEGTSDPSGGEGSGSAATASDVTWSHRIYQTDTWSVPGGDVVGAAVSNGLLPSALGETQTALPLNVVSDWLSGSPNDGLLIRLTNEGSGEARQLGSRTNPAGNGPKLIVTYTEAMTGTDTTLGDTTGGDASEDVFEDTVMEDVSPDTTGPADTAPIEDVIDDVDDAMDASDDVAGDATADDTTPVSVPDTTPAADTGVSDCSPPVTDTTVGDDAATATTETDAATGSGDTLDDEGCSAADSHNAGFLLVALLGLLGLALTRSRQDA